MKMKKLPSEANSEQGDMSGEGRLGECPLGSFSDIHVMRSHPAWTERSGVKTSSERGNA
jgi:hypothetical protein